MSACGDRLTQSEALSFVCTRPSGHVGSHASDDTAWWDGDSYQVAGLIWRDDDTGCTVWPGPPERRGDR